MLSIKSKIVIVTFLSVLKINALYAGKIRINDVNKLSQSDKVRASQLYKEYDQLKGNDSKRTQIIKQMMDFGRPVAQTMFERIDRELKKKWPLYQRAYVECAKKAGFKKTTPKTRQEIMLLEQKVQSLRALGDRLTKDEIKRTGDPALKRLRDLKVMKIDELFSINPLLQKKREYISSLVEQRKICMDRLVLVESNVDKFGTHTLINYEINTSTSVLGPPREDMQILESNKKISNLIRPSEASAIRDMNEYRIMIGLKPCIIDPKLCFASREHSKDMEEKGFFDHDSPIKGKKTPWIRAKLAGTKANSENIYKGNQSGKAANQAWWYSPGHHLNMLNPDAKRVGMGLTGKHWTQMFGH